MPEKEWMITSNLDLTSSYDKIMFLSHFAAYKKVQNFVKDLNVLEIGCGSGYGSKFLSKVTKSITTVDIDNDSLEYAKKNNFANNINYVNTDVTKGLPFKNNIFDIAISFQVIEHIDPKQINIFLSEIKRVVQPGGLIIFTTPNRNIRLQKFQKPRNPYHKIEYSEKTLRRLLEKYFPVVDILGLQAKEEIHKLKLNMKQSMFQAYIRNPIRDFILKMSTFLNLKMIKNILDSRSNRPMKKTKNEGIKPEEISLSNFWFSQEKVNLSIDLMAICKNEK